VGKKSARKAPRVRDGKTRDEKARDVFVARPFEGLADEPEWVALRELVPAATAPLRLTPDYAGEYGQREITLATVLPMAWPALTKPDGRIFLGLQRNDKSGDVNRDLAAALLKALETEPGKSVTMPLLPGLGPRLADVIVNEPLSITMRDGFDFWLDEEQERDENVAASLEAANASIFPTEKMAAAPAAYWCRVPGKAHVRWVMPQPEDKALNALARLSAAGQIKLGDDTRFAGMFRAHSLLAPVWDLPSGPPATDWEEPVAAFATRYAAALRDDPLTAEERRAKQGLLGRMLSIR
jgi:Family of unknown function (DUF5926)